MLRILNLFTIYVLNVYESDVPVYICNLFEYEIDGFFLFAPFIHAIYGLLFRIAVLVVFACLFVLLAILFVSVVFFVGTFSGLFFFYIFGKMYSSDGENFLS